MQTLEKHVPRDISLYGPDWEKKLDLPASNLIAMDKRILMAATIPMEKRKLSEFLKQKQHTYRKLKGKELRYEINRCRRRISVVNAIEEGRLSAMGKYPAVTNSVFGELKYFDGSSKDKNIKEWFKKMSGQVCSVFLDVEDYRHKYPVISRSLKKNESFSLAAASIELGCNIATDDHDSFEMSVVNRIKNKHREKWPRSEFTNYDSVSLSMLMGI
jgi:hypothetical protein